MPAGQPKDRDEGSRLADEQASLRRVATLVARGASSHEVFGAVAEEVGQVMRIPIVVLGRFDDDGAAITILAVWSDREVPFRTGMRWPLDGPSVVAEVFRTGRPARVDDYTNRPGAVAAFARESGINRTAGAPITVDGRVWGAMITPSADTPLTEGVEGHLAEFTDLVATAISNSQAREDLRQLAEEQAALRRVATLVARRASPAALFRAVSAEVGRLLPADWAGLARYEAGATVTLVGVWRRTSGYNPSGERSPLDRGPGVAQVYETGRPARIDSYEGVPGAAAARARAGGLRSSVLAPIVVEGRLWGVMAVASMSDERLPPDTEGRLTQFSELMATAVANAQSRSEVAESRARLVATADATRQRIERDLHDGAQQQLVALALELRAAQEAVPSEQDELRAELSRVVDGLTNVVDELREIAHGIHPAILTEGGLGPALKILGRRSAVPVNLELRHELRLPERVEVAAYYVVAEALANTAKHANASAVNVDLEVRDRVLQVSVRDDGVGGADPARGSGLVGLKDRAEAIGGAISLQSPLGDGTLLQVDLPLEGDTE